MILADLSWKKRRELIALHLNVALQDLTAPAPTIEVARMIAARLETGEVALICQSLVRHIAPHIPQAHQTEARQTRYGLRRAWIWSPKRAKVPAWDR